MTTHSTIIGPTGDELAYRHHPGATPTLVFLGGFRSDMSGLKAHAIERFARRHGHAVLCLDYSGHGASGGDFIDGAVSVWTNDASAVIDAVTDGPLILVGSSMGGWIMTLLAQRDPRRVAALVGLAAAPDFAADSLPARLDRAARDALAADGVAYLPSRYGDGPYPITAKLIADADAHRVLGRTIAIDCPVRLLHGLADPDVPWERSVALANALRSKDVRVELIKEAGHRLSEPQELTRIEAVLEELLETL